MTNDAPERIWFTKVGRDTVPNSERKATTDVEYIRAVHAQAEKDAAVAAAYEDCWEQGKQAGRFAPDIPADAQAALEDRDKRVWNEALKAALALSWLCFHKCNDEVEVVTADDILALMEDKDDD